MIVFYYADTPMQHTAIFHGCKNVNFQMKNYNIFLIFAQNIDCGYTLEPASMSTHNLCFRAKRRKNVYPCTPQFRYIKMGCILMCYRLLQMGNLMVVVRRGYSLSLCVFEWHRYLIRHFLEETPKHSVTVLAVV